MARALLTGLALLLAGCDPSRLMLFPDAARRAVDRRPVSPDEHGQVYRVVDASNVAGHRLRGWLFEARGDHGLALVANGNGTALPHTYDYNRFLIGRGYRVLVFSYQGYDENGGTAALTSLVGDWQAFHAIARDRYPGEPIVFVGESMGAAAALCAAAAGPAPDGLVLEAVPDLKRLPYTRLLGFWPLYPLLPLTLPAAALVSAGVPSALDTAACAPKVRVPALLVHHPADRVTPLAHARRIAGRYGGGARLVLSDAGPHPSHHLILAVDQRARDAVIRFVDERLARP